MEHSTAISALCLVVVLLSCSSADDKIVSTDVHIRAQQTLEGLLHYYWETDPQYKKIGYFSACGDIGDPCYCESPSPSACASCYRWWDAIAMESIATYGIYAQTKNNSVIPSIIFAHSPYNANWPGDVSCTYVDDFAWYGLAYLRTYEWLKVYKDIRLLVLIVCCVIVCVAFFAGSQVAESFC